MHSRRDTLFSVIPLPARHCPALSAANPKQITIAALLLCIGTASIHAQTFATASIKPNNSYDQSGVLKPTPGALNAQNISLKFCIQWARNLKEYQLSVPATLKTAAEMHYDIVARSEGTATSDQLRVMLQALLIERFHLAVHSEKKDAPVFALTVAKNGPKKLSPPAPDNVPHMNIDSAHTEGGQHWLFHNEPASAVIGLISNGLSRPVIDKTGIQGSFDFLFILPPWDRDQGSLGDHMISDVFPELETQLGLRIQSQTAPIDTLIVDRVDPAPTAN